MNERGRAPFILTPLSAFTTGFDGNDPIVPYDGELCYDDLGDKSEGHIEYSIENGEDTWKFVSTTQDVNNYLKSLKNTGLFDNAIAGVMSKELSYFLYNLETRSIIFNDKIVYDDNFRYYSIRKGYEFVTGKDFNGTIVNVCDMTRSETESGSGVYVRKPSIGTILPDITIVDGDSYIVEFFDANRKLIGRDVFYAEYTSVFTGDTSDAAISSLSVITTRPYVEAGNDAVFLYKGESIDQLAYSLVIVYNNGDSRDVTHELSKLTITGLNTIDTSVITENEPYTVTFEYNPGVEIGISVSKDINVYIINDVTAEVADLVPVYYYTTSLIDSIIRRYFAVMDNGTFYEITSKLSDDQPVNYNNLPTATGQRRTIEVEFNLGIFDQIPETFDYSIDTITELSTLRIRRFINAESTNDLYKRISVIDESLGLWGTFNISEVTRGENIPTHFRLKTIDGFLITNDIIVGSYSLFSKNENTATIVANKNTPILVEFFNNDVITKVIVAYFN